MNKYFKILVTLAITVLCASGLYAQSGGYKGAGTSASAFLKLPFGSPRAQALGNAYVSLADGADSLFWNPAGISTATSREVHLSYLDWLQGYKARTLSYIQPMGKTIIALSGNYMDMDGFEWRNSQGTPQTEGVDGDVRNFVGMASIARGFFDNIFQIGGTFKYINENNVGEHYNNVAFDVGAKLDFNKVGLGFAAVNLGDSDEVPTGLRGGAHFQTKYWTVVGEIIKYTDYRLQYGVGLEIHIPEDLLQVARFDLRAGYYSREDTGKSDESWTEKIGLDNTSKVSFGFGLYSDEVFGYGTRIDFAMTPFGALGTTYNVAVGVQF
ncbi:hypothetical protein Emin_1212 [Elusimicrobium minutum Pei191]|uniref:PorV/PorQ family protein n=1 Tax=Elusimicrobium minutum (strain Pei191) TaxID=445932 RepID=B2KE16_ELUMP|nr:hypothetical protein [Elusimicrobium minutum]ACC98762.1 hypothetical protein Emin_1212 [Elusimicrobium minutum Pei191]